MGGAVLQVAVQKMGGAGIVQQAVVWVVGGAVLQVAA